jgi:hypothetical protein
MSRTSSQLRLSKGTTSCFRPLRTVGGGCDASLYCLCSILRRALLLGGTLALAEAGAAVLEATVFRLCGDAISC